MKITFFIQRLSYSGAPKIMAWIASGLAKKGHDVMMVVAYKSKCEQSLDERVKMVYLDKPQSEKWLYRNTIGMFRAISGFRKVIKETKPDVLISFLDSVSQVYIVLNKLFWKNAIVVSERGDPYSRKKIQDKFFVPLMKRCSLIVFQTEEAKGFFEKKCKTLNDCVIPNPIVLNRSVRDAINKRKQFDYSSKEALKIVSVGRLTLEQKRQDILLKAMAELKKKSVKFKLYIYGSGPDEAIIKDLIKKLSLENEVKMMGQMDDIPSRISDADCFILTSDHEGIPNALAEAMSIGIPCISTDCSPGGAKLLIKDGVNGFLVDRGDYDAIADRIAWLKEHKEKCKKIGENATKIADTFSEKKVINAWEEEIMKVVKK